MKFEEAIYTLNGLFMINCANANFETTKEMTALETAISALEKQIPKKIKRRLCKVYCPSDDWYPDSGHEDTWNEKEGYWLEEHDICPTCGIDVKFGDKYCENCGQALDWSKGETEC